MSAHVYASREYRFQMLFNCLRWSYVVLCERAFTESSRGERAGRGRQWEGGVVVLVVLGVERNRLRVQEGGRQASVHT